MNKQPFYHCTQILFTATKQYSKAELEELLNKKFVFKWTDIIHQSFTVEELDAEPGDPYDLL